MKSSYHTKTRNHKNSKIGLVRFIFGMVFRFGFKMHRVSSTRTRERGLVCSIILILLVQSSFTSQWAGPFFPPSAIAQPFAAHGRQIGALFLYDVCCVKVSTRRPRYGPALLQKRMKYRIRFWEPFGKFPTSFGNYQKGS